MQELRSELLSSSSPRPSSASQGWGSWQARPLCVNLCPLHPGSLLMREREKPTGEGGQEQAAAGARGRVASDGHCCVDYPSSASSHKSQGSHTISVPLTRTGPTQSLSLRAQLNGIILER